MQQRNSPGPDLGADQPDSHADQLADVSVPQARMQQAMRLSGADFRKSLADADSISGTAPLNILSERCGGKSRRTYLKRKAANMSRSAFEIFAFSTSRTTSIEDASMFFPLSAMQVDKLQAQGFTHVYFIEYIKYTEYINYILYI